MNDVLLYQGDGVTRKWTLSPSLKELVDVRVDALPVPFTQPTWNTVELTEAPMVGTQVSFEFIEIIPTVRYARAKKETAVVPGAVRTTVLAVPVEFPKYHRVDLRGDMCLGLSHNDSFSRFHAFHFPLPEGPITEFALIGQYDTTHGAPVVSADTQYSLVVAGGHTGSDATRTAYRITFDAFGPYTIDSLPSMPVSKYGNSAGALFCPDVGLIIMGNRGVTPSTNVHILKGFEGGPWRWSALASCPAPGCLPLAHFKADGKNYVVCMPQANWTAAYTYCFETNTWTTTASPPASLLGVKENSDGTAVGQGQDGKLYSLSIVDDAVVFADTGETGVRLGSNVNIWVRAFTARDTTYQPIYFNETSILVKEST